MNLWNTRYLHDSAGKRVDRDLLEKKHTHDRHTKVDTRPTESMWVINLCDHHIQNEWSLARGNSCGLQRWRYTANHENGLTMGWFNH